MCWYNCHNRYLVEHAKLGSFCLSPLSLLNDIHLQTVGESGGFRPGRHCEYSNRGERSGPLPIRSSRSAGRIDRRRPCGSLRARIRAAGGSRSVFAGLDDHAPAAPPDDIAAALDGESAFPDQAPQGIGKRGIMKNPPSSCTGPAQANRTRYRRDLPTEPA